MYILYILYILAIWAILAILATHSHPVAQSPTHDLARASVPNRGAAHKVRTPLFPRNAAEPSPKH